MTFEEFLAGSFEPLARYARLLSTSREDGDDLLADALLVAQRKWEHIGSLEHPRAYVRRIISTRHVRISTTWIRRKVETRDPIELPDRGVLDDDVLRSIDRSELSDWLITLPVRQRTAVVLRYFFDLDHAQIAAELSISSTAARTLVSRGLAALRIVGAADRANTEQLLEKS